MICGDGHRAVSSLLSVDSFPHSFHEVSINFPEPPVWEESKNALLTIPLYKQIHQLLHPDGFFRIITDNEVYCHELSKDLTRLVQFFASRHHPHPFVSFLPKDFGSVSYFDHLWKKGRHLDRFWIEFAPISK